MTGVTDKYEVCTLIIATITAIAIITTVIIITVIIITTTIAIIIIALSRTSRPSELPQPPLIP